MKTWHKYLQYILIVLTIVACVKNKETTSLEETTKNTPFQNFVTVTGNKLMDGDKEFRFVSFNVPTLNYNEDEFGFEKKQPYSLPTEFEIRDVMETITQMGGKVIRMYTIPVRMESESTEAPTYVEAPGVFNEEAFKTMDRVLALANEYNVRIIFSLLNNWQWMGGRPQYAYMRGKTANEFYTDPQLVDDFKKTVEHVITRTNTITGTKYSEDKAILCWETGNELQCTEEWTKEICAYIKKLDQNHLVMDGFFAIDAITVRESSIIDPNIDIISSHHYEQNPTDFMHHVNANIKIIDGRKPYLIGEFGFVGTPAIEQCIDKVIQDGLVGILIWGLRGHREEGGFYWHSEPLGYGRYKSYHWPGFTSGNEYDEINILHMLRQKAYAIDGESVPAMKIPAKPELLPIPDVANISWKGSAGASHYNLYRSENENGIWNIIAFNLTDADIQYESLYHDNTAKLGKTYFYKLIAKNSNGISKSSEPSNPVHVKSLALVDNMENFGKLYYGSSNLQIATADDRMFKEDMFRMKCNPGTELVYFVPGNITSIKIHSYCQDDIENLSFEVSNDNQHYTAFRPLRTSHNNGKGDYGYWVPIAYSSDKKTEASYLKIKAVNETQIGRVEIQYH